MRLQLDSGKERSFGGAGFLVHLMLMAQQAQQTSRVCKVLVTSRILTRRIYKVVRVCPCACSIQSVCGRSEDLLHILRGCIISHLWHFEVASELLD